MVAISVFLVLAACSKESNSVIEPVPKIHKETYPKNAIELRVESEVVGDVIKLDILLENTSNKDIPLFYGDEEIFSITSIGDNDAVIENYAVIEKNRTQLNAGENAKFPFEIALNSTEPLKLQTKLNLMEDSYPAEFISNLPINTLELDLKQAKLPFMPSSRSVYYYENPNEEGLGFSEEYMFFEDKYIQSLNSYNGVNVYEQKKDGIHLVETNIDSSSSYLIDKVKGEPSSLLIPFHKEIGFKWSAKDTDYEIVDTKSELKTPYKEFSDVLVIESNSGNKVRYFYQEEVGLLQIDLVDGDDAITQYTLKDIKKVEIKG